LTFLSPIPALIAAAITVPGLLILYFLKLRRRPVRVSSTLLWDQAIRDLQVNVPFRLIRPTWLLLLQLLILALFLLALARPAIDLAGGSPTRVVFMIDRSASMSARDVVRGGAGVGNEERAQSRLEIAKERALARLDQLGRSGSTFAVIEVAAEAVMVSSFSSPSAARAAIEKIEPTDQPGDLRAALQLASGLLSGDTDESVTRARGLAVLFSDGSFAGADEGLTLAGAEFRYERIGPVKETPAGEEGATQAAGHDNLGIVAIAARREWEDPAAIRVFARLLNASDRAVTAPVVLSMDGREAESTIVTVPSKPDGGTSAATFKMETREGGVANVRIGWEDVLAADNVASLVVAPASKPRVLVVVPDAPAGGAGGTGAAAQPKFEWIITNIIEELRLPMRTMNASLYAQEAAAGTLRYDVVVFDRVRPTEPPPIPSLSFGAGIGQVAVGAEFEGGTYFLSWKRSHPVLRHAALDGVNIARPRSMSGFDADGELATGSDGPLIAEASGPGPRRIVCAFELSLTNWPVQVGFPIFLASAMDYLSLKAEERAGRAFTTAEPARLEAGLTGEVVLEGPRRIAARAGADPKAAVSLGILERAGVYRGPGDISLAVNLLDETESAVAVRDTLRVSGQVVHGAAGEGGPREIWSWLVLAALVLLSVEWLVNAWMMRV
jgi:hypothetical protein